MPQLSLDCLTLTDTSPPDVIRSAAAAGFDLVSLWVQPPPMYPAAQTTPDHIRECTALLADTCVQVWSLEVFDLVSEDALESYRPALELGAQLGGKAALAYQLTNSDHGHAAELLAAFTEIAGEYGLAVNFEPVAMGQTATLAQARDLIRASGADVGIMFDAWHLIRSGCGIDELRAIEPELIRYVQINDGLATIPDEQMIPESIGERLYPGAGEFPLAELLRACPRDVPWAIETPSLRRASAGMTAKAQAREAMAALQMLIGAL
ncbi:MAG: sugar phosphate isomerase/epimerase [Novosphingobium sp.]